MLKNPFIIGGELELIKEDEAKLNYLFEPRFEAKKDEWKRHRNFCDLQKDFRKDLTEFGFYPFIPQKTEEQKQNNNIMKFCNINSFGYSDYVKKIYSSGINLIQKYKAANKNNIEPKEFKKILRKKNYQNDSFANSYKYKRREKMKRCVSAKETRKKYKLLNKSKKFGFSSENKVIINKETKAIEPQEKESDNNSFIYEKNNKNKNENKIRIKKREQSLIYFYYKVNNALNKINNDKVNTKNIIEEKILPKNKTNNISNIGETLENNGKKNILKSTIIKNLKLSRTNGNEQKKKKGIKSLSYIKNHCNLCKPIVKQVLDEKGKIKNIADLSSLLCYCNEKNKKTAKKRNINNALLYYRFCNLNQSSLMKSSATIDLFNNTEQKKKILKYTTKKNPKNSSVNSVNISTGVTNKKRASSSLIINRDRDAYRNKDSLFAYEESKIINKNK